MKTFYWGDQPNNFGDMLTGSLLDHFGIKYNHTNVHENGKYFCIGSIARLATFGSKVYGSGIIRQGENLNPLVDWKFVRGPLTRQRIIECGGNCPEIYCDPALLLPRFCEESDKEYEVGLVPHYQHMMMLGSKRDEYKIIDVVNENPIEVAREITKCKKIMSSSLHGIICAHAYGIPAAYIITGKKLHGDGSKFLDYFASVGLEAKPSTIDKPIYTIPKELPDFERVAEIFEELGEDDD